MNIDIIFDNVMAKVEPYDIAAYKILDENLKYKPEGADRTYNVRFGGASGYKPLFNSVNGTFRRGLVHRAAKLLLDSGHFTVRLIDNTTDTSEIEYRIKYSNIRPYEFQSSVVPIAQNNKIGLIVSPTGSGKTLMASYVISAIKRKTIILVTDVVLLDQMQQAMQKYFDHTIGIIGDGEFEIEDITVSTIQSLLSAMKARSIKAANNRVKLLEHFKDVGLVISDEAHLYDSASVSALMPVFSNTARVLGYSATPYGWAESAEKRQNMELEQHFGKVIYDCRKNDFIKLGLKVPILVHGHNLPYIQKEYKDIYKNTRAGKEIDFSKCYKACLDAEILQNEAYHMEVAKHAWSHIIQGQSVFIHAAHSIKFGEEIQKLIPGSVFVSGSTPRLERRRIYDAMRKKEILALVSDVGATGLDIPNLDAMILASDLKDTRQLIGRIERAAPNKTQGEVHDLFKRCMFLGKHSTIRQSQYTHAKYNITGDYNDRDDSKHERSEWLFQDDD